jgi:predicted dehydrogenase
LNKIGIGVIGLGGRGLYLGESFGRDPHAELVAVCDLNAPRLEASRKVFGGGVSYYLESKELLADPRVQAVIIATNDAAHGANGLEVLKARKHLFLEKPMAQTIKECDAMIAAWKRSGVVFMVGLELRYCTLCQEMKTILERGEIGEIKLAYAVDNVSVGGDYYYHDRRRLKEYIVSLILEKGTHTLDLMNWFINAEPVRVYAEAGLDVFGGSEPNDKRCRDCERKDSCPYYVSYEGFQMDYGQVLKMKEDLCVYAEEADVHDNSIVTVRYDNGAKMSYIECHFTPDYSREFTLIGTKGRMYGFYNNEQDFRIELTYRHSKEKEVLYPPKREGGHGGGDPMIQKEFLERIQKGLPACPGILGARNSAAVAIAATQAAHTGRPVAIPLAKLEKDCD